MENVVLTGEDGRCPVCNERKAEHRAVIPMVADNGDVIEPHNYGVCDLCHRGQYIRKYGFAPGEGVPEKARTLRAKG